MIFRLPGQRYQPDEPQRQRVVASKASRLDLAGSSLSALDLGAELTDGSGIGSGSAKTPVAIDGSDEEFQLVAFGRRLWTPILESSSQVIEVEDSEVVGDAVDLSRRFR